MVTISLCMIVKNEEAVLERCLKSASGLVDEIIIVDTGSEDRTKEIAGKYTEQVYDFTWVDDFSAARNFSFSKATKEYCMWLDADDVILEEDCDRFLELKKALDPSVDVVMMPYHTAFDENGKPTYLYYRERILRNSTDYRWDGEVHEAITPKGNVIYAEVSVTHKKMQPGDPERNLKILEKKHQSGAFMSPRQQFYYGQELYFNKRYETAISILEAFLEMKDGWIENQLEACKRLSHCYAQIGKDELALRALLRSLELEVPRGEVCCELGYHFFKKSAYEQAIFWYELALSRPYNDKTGAFVHIDCYGYIPNLQLAVCYDRLGQWEKASEYNESAAKLKPDSEAVIANRNYFENKYKQVKRRE